MSISKVSLGIAELLIDGSKAVVASPIVEGLDNKSHGAAPYSDNFREEIIHVTTNETDHSQYLAAAAATLGENIRNALGNIKKYGIPFAIAIAKNASVLMGKDDKYALAVDDLKIEYANMDDPILHSGVYPTEVKNKLLTYEGVDLNFLKNMKFDYVSEDDVHKFIGSSHPEIQTILDDGEWSISSVATSLADLGELAYLFEEKDGVVNFTRIKTLNFKWLMKAYVLLSKMMVSEAPAPWYKEGTLEDYRTLVNLLWNGIVTYLIKLKVVMDQYRAMGLAVEAVEPVRLVQAGANLKDAKVLKGKVKVFFSNGVIEKLDAGGVSVAEVVVANYWRQALGQQTSISELVANAADGASLVKSALNNYIEEHLGASIRTTGLEYFLAGQRKGLTEFFNQPENQSLQALISKNLPAGENFIASLAQALRGQLEGLYNLCFNDQNYRNAQVLIADGEPEYGPALEIVLNTNLVGTFLELGQFKVAAEIIKDTAALVEEDNLQSKRERLHVAIINFIVKNSLSAAPVAAA